MSDDDWLLASAEEDGHRVLYRCRKQVPSGTDTALFPHLINIYWRFDGKDNDGMPAKALHDRMRDLETRTESVEGRGVGFLVLAITGNNRKEWIWYVRDPAEYMVEINVALAGGDPYPVEFETVADPQWENFRGLLAGLGQSGQ